MILLKVNTKSVQKLTKNVTETCSQSGCIVNKCICKRFLLKIFSRYYIYNFAVSINAHNWKKNHFQIMHFFRVPHVIERIYFFAIELRLLPNMRWYPVPTEDHTIVPCNDWRSGCELMAGLGSYGSPNPSSGGVTSKPMLPFRAIFIPLWCCCCCCCWCCSNELKCDIPISSRLLLRRLTPALGSPCLKELERRRSMSSVTRSELDLPRRAPVTVGLSGSERELALVVARGGARGELNPETPAPEPRRLFAPWDAIDWIRLWEQKLMFDLRRLLCRSNVFWAENGDGLTRYLKDYLFIL